MGFWDGSGISWTICKQPAPCFRQITITTSHHSIFTGQMLLLTPIQQCQSTEVTVTNTVSVAVPCSHVHLCGSSWHFYRSCAFPVA